MPYRIIVADPSPSMQKIAQAVFPEPEFRIYPFEDGPSLLEAMDGVRPDAVLVSLSLSAPGGAEIGRALRGREGLGSFPVVGLRGGFEPADLERIKDGDYDRIVQKPFDSERLAAAVRELIARKTGPSTMPEEPVWPPSGEPEEGPAALPPHERLPGDLREKLPSGPPGRPDDRDRLRDPGFREWVRSEVGGLEREIEKRLRAVLLAELREWESRQARSPGPRE